MLFLYKLCCMVVSHLCSKIMYCLTTRAAMYRYINALLFSSFESS